MRGLDARQLAEWEAFYEAEPFGLVRQDWRVAIAGAGVMSMLKTGDSVNPRRLLPVRPPQDPEHAARLQRAQMQSLALSTSEKK